MSREDQKRSEEQRIYEAALRDYWRANTPSLAADGPAYRRRQLARRRRTSG